jgi:flagella basal body P-ring formation protein FlgA
MIKEGTVLTQSYIQKIPPVLQNQKIKVLTHVANIEISTFGRAVSDGNFGEKIIVQPEGTHERILATVVAKGLVEVE